MVAASPASSFSTHGFSADFFQPYVANTQLPAICADDGAGPRISYCEAAYGSYRRFCRSSDFSKYQSQFRQDLDFLRDFCRQHSMPDANEIRQRFDTLFLRRFEMAYFDTHAELIDSRGKQSLDNFCAMIRDERINVDVRRNAIRDLSQGVLVCAAGTTANLMAADRDLAMSANGIRGALWKAKEDLTRDVLLQAVAAEFGKESSYRSYEIHYVNAAWNHIAQSVGLLEIPDWAAPNLSQAFLDSCKDSVLAAMQPERIACLIADQCLATFTSRVAAHGQTGDLTARKNGMFGEILDDIREQYQLEPEALGLHVFLRLDDDGSCYRLRHDGALIAQDLLRIMNREKLLNGSPRNRGEWQGADGDQYALFTFGADLAWRACKAGAVFGLSDWNLDAELITVGDLREWSELYCPDGGELPASALRQVLRASDPQDLLNVPVSWLSDANLLLAMLARLDVEQIQQYLESNISYFTKECPAQDVAALIDSHMGTGDAILRIACARYTDPWILVSEKRDVDGRSRLQRWMALNNGAAIDALLSSVDGMPYLETGNRVTRASAYHLILNGSQSNPALDEAMAANNAKAIGAWHRLLTHSTVIDHVRPWLPQLVGKHVLEQALRRGHADAIRALHAILVDPAILPHIEDLPALLAARSAGVPGLNRAMREDHAGAVDAFHALVSNPDILPHIKCALPELLIASSRLTSGLDEALANGCWKAISSFHAMLADPVILPWIVAELPKFVYSSLVVRREWPSDMTGNPGGVPTRGLTVLLSPHIGSCTGWQAAMRGNHGLAIRAFGRLLADPAINPHIQFALSSLLAAPDPDGVTGLGYALRRGNTEAVQEFHALVTHPDILKHIGPNLPRMLAAVSSGGTPGLCDAMRNGCDTSIAAFGDLLADPAVLPYIKPVLADLVAARDKSGKTGLEWAIQYRRTKAIAAFHNMRSRPEIARHIQAELATWLPAVEERIWEDATGSIRVMGSSPPDTSLRTRARRTFHNAVSRLRSFFATSP